jgi:hypothetical protein
MPRLWLGNFDFETTLAGENPSAELQRFGAEWGFAFLPMAQAGDVIAMTEDFDLGFVRELQQRLGLPDVRFCSLNEIASGPSDFELVPWGWSGAAVSLARRLRCRHNAPPIEAVRRVHCREFSFRLAADWGVQPDGVAGIESVEELSARVREQPTDEQWVIKSQWGASGRGQLRRRGDVLSDQDARWAASLLRRDGVLFWEPWLESLGEAGLQFDIPIEGEPRLVAIVPMLTDRHGQYAGSVIPQLHDEPLLEPWPEAVEVGLWVCERMQSEGYHGPVGIDAMRYRDASGAERLRPIQEINARWTMGRLAAAWRRYLPADAKAQWVRESFPAGAEEFPHRAATSPALPGGRPTHSRMELRWM